ncbi:hypothetical protein CK203_108317 [Vitis vinifera]|uniref:Uncharacterized protein n=1 Tax=Vitis vinifera TaxID=29760 RepID=A0A438FFU7_VITVI|nr:hypothetical protein CK203_108317 [Vitis vinifera]
MKLKVVNLGCKRCYKKIKKLLFKFPGTFIEKEDTVIIKVVCSYPEMIRTKLFYKGSDTIKSIEVIPPEKPPPPPPPPPPTPVANSSTRCHPMMAGLLGVAVTEAMVAAVNSILKKIPHAPSCESYSIVIVVICHAMRDVVVALPPGYGIPHQPPSYDGYVRLVPSYGPNLEEAHLMKE